MRIWKGDKRRITTVGGRRGGDSLREAWEELAAEDAQAPPSGVTMQSTRGAVRKGREDTSIKIFSFFQTNNTKVPQGGSFPSSGEANALKAIPGTVLAYPH
jgi:hypothetical protein